MKTEKNIMIAFFLNLFFSAFELAGGLFTGSVAILSDSVHDLGDALTIGVSWLLERKSRKQPDQVYTYGYARYSVVGSIITTMVLILGSVLVIYQSVLRIIHPVPIHYDGMILMGIFGVLVNLAAAFFTKEGGSLNQRAVNLHMLEDVLGWIVVLLGAVIMRFTDISLIDPLMSVAVSVFILASSLKNLKEIADVFLEKVPSGMEIAEIKKHLLALDGVKDVHHIHLWTLDGHNHYASLHIATNDNPKAVKEAVRSEMTKHGIGHITIETETPDEACTERECHLEAHPTGGHHHH